LPIVGNGDNLVPTIHLIDLARIVRRIVVEKPQKKEYIFAIDRTKRPTQKRIVQAISDGIGTKKISHIQPKKDHTAYWNDFLTINLKIKTSDVFKDGELTPE
jgi:adenylate kinase